MLYTVRNFLVAFFAFGVALYALVAYGFFTLGSLVHPAMKTSFMAHSIGIYAHVFASAIALLLGPLQFSTKLRANYITLHRWNGRVYLFLGVLLGGSAGLYVAQFAYGGLLAKTGFSLLAMAWLHSGFMAYSAIRRNNIAEHQRWMQRNFALTFAAVTLRIYLGSFMAAGVRFEVFYPWLAWLCWVPNLLLMEWWLGSFKSEEE
ncbi:MAG: DUF2306 domain-containing protein [Gammaproteobacteria bacterium]|nr:DUF2306 domain-containing protein [Gammaproteobacteria bacterium]